MVNKDKRVDAYIARSATFAKPILSHIRGLVHKALPGVAETMKWSFPHFDYHGTVCSMAAFKEHCAFGFWKAAIMSDPEKILDRRNAMGHFGRITKLQDLAPDKILIAYMKEAAKLNEEGVKLPPRKKVDRSNMKIPVYFMSALKKNKNALDAFEQFSPSHKHEYVEWVTEAKTEETKTRRLTTAVEWISKGKARNWKYARM